MPSTFQEKRPFQTARRRKKDVKEIGCENSTGSSLGAVMVISEHSNETSGSKKAFHCLNK